MLDLTGRVALVTGATRGIGRAIAGRLVRHGAHVAIAARTRAAVEKEAARLQQDAARSGQQVLGIAANVGRYEDCQALVAQTVETLGRLDILINNAGIGGLKPAAEMTVEQWRAVIDTNLNSLFYCCREALPHLRKAGQSWIINMGSLAGKNAFPRGTAYNASKFGLIGFSEALMQEVRYDGIRVSYIMPGSVATDFEGMSPGSADWMIQPEDIADIVVDLLSQPERTLISRVEVRPSKPAKR